MTVVGIGLDIVAVDRLAAAIARRRDRFLARVFAEPELAEFTGRGLSGPGEAQYLAGRFAAKEAAAKALGTGIGPLGWRNIQIAGDRSVPVCRLTGPAAAVALRAGVQRVLVTITHEAGVAAACAVALGCAGAGDAR